MFHEEQYFSVNNESKLHLRDISILCMWLTSERGEPLLPRLQGKETERMEKTQRRQFGTHGRSPKADERQILPSCLYPAGKNPEAALRNMRKSKSRSASLELRQASGGSMVVPEASFGNYRSRKDRTLPVRQSAPLSGVGGLPGLSCRLSVEMEKGEGGQTCNQPN
jgi:hypothetical protein